MKKQKVEKISMSTKATEDNWDKIDKYDLSFYCELYIDIAKDDEKPLKLENGFTIKDEFTRASQIIHLEFIDTFEKVDKFATKAVEFPFGKQRTALKLKIIDKYFKGFEEDDIDIEILERHSLDKI